MDCRWALEILDSARPDSADWQESELEEAAAHVDGCPACEETFRARMALDRRIGAVMRQVPVPDDLLGRLTLAVSQAPSHLKLTTSDELSSAEQESEVRAGSMGQSPSKATTPAAPPAKIGRRHWLRQVAVAAVVSALAVGGWFVFRPAAPTLALEDVRDSAPLQLDGVEVFDGNFNAGAPLGWDSSSLRVSQTVKGAGRSRSDHHQMALIGFEFDDWNGTPVNGVLLVVPRRDVIDATDLPASFTEAMGSPGYTNRAWGGYTTISWASDEFVYVCFVPEEGNARQRLEHILGGEAA